NSRRQARVLRTLDWPTPSRIWPEDGEDSPSPQGERAGVRGKKMWLSSRPMFKSMFIRVHPWFNSAVMNHGHRFAGILASVLALAPPSASAQDPATSSGAARARQVQALVDGAVHQTLAKF